MAKIQTRRTVSMNRDTYERLKEYAEHKGQPMAQIVDKLVNGWCDAIDTKRREQAA